jgi:uncharacterized Tic20 family protein
MGLLFVKPFKFPARKKAGHHAMNNPSKDGVPQTARITRSKRQQAEKRLICAILHGISPFGFIAPVASAVVLTTQRRKSRLIAYQTFQALIFQIFAFVCLIITSILFIAGFVFTAQSGLIARTGVNEPELTTALIIAGGLGFGSIWFFQMILPLWGVWAGVRVLAGKDFRYPILNRLALKWAAKDTDAVTRQSEDGSDALEASNDESILAGLVYASVLGGLAPILAPILWAITKQRSKFLSFHLFQAALFQLLTLGIGYISMFSLFVIMLFSAIFHGPQVHVIEPFFQVLDTPIFSFCVMGIILIFALFSGLFSVIGAIRAFKGQNFYFPMLGSWLDNYFSK